MRLLLLCLLLSTGLAAQRPRVYTGKDSIAYYNHQIGQMRRALYDSLHKSEAFQNARNHVERLRSKSENYGAFALFTEFCHADYEKFNADNAQAGFGALKPWLPRIGFGYSGKKGRRMFDFYYAVIGISNRVKKESGKISANLTNLFQFEWGYNIVKSRSFNLYPYAGFSIRLSDITYDTASIANTNGGNITAFIQSDKSVSLGSGKLGYQAGLAMEFLIAESREGTAGTMLFIKAGTNSSFTKEKYRHGGIKYEPGIRQADWMVSLGFKFFGRK